MNRPLRPHRELRRQVANRKQVSLMKTKTIVIASLWILAGGCGTSSRGPSVDGETRLDRASDSANAAPLSISLDGKASEWQGVDPVWEEGGASGTGDLPGSVDIQQVHFRNDEDFLYVFLRTSPTVQKRFADTGSSGELCDVFFDTDNDSATGCTDVDGFDYGKINGYDFRLWVPLGVQSGSEGSLPFVSYELQPADASGRFMFNAVIASQSVDSNALIQHGEEGVEMAIPLEPLGVKPGSTIRLLFKESVDPFDKQRYNEGTYIVQ